MKNVHENLRKARIKAGYKSAAKFAKSIEVDEATYRHHENGTRGIDIYTLGKYAKALGVDVNSLFAEESTASDEEFTKDQFPIRAIEYSRMQDVSRSPLNIMVPVYGPAAASNPEVVLLTEDYILEYKPCPVELQMVKEAFLIVVSGDSMFPRYENGDIASVHKHKFPKPGQDCLIVMNDEGNALIKRYTGQTETTWKFSQFNPSKDFEIAKSKIREIHSIVGRAS